MRLILENFRQHKSLDLTIPDVGLIKLHGPSGVGKTTVFDGILEALYGEADDVTPWGESRSKVTFSFKNIEIIRTRGPVSLLVTVNGNDQYRDASGQAVIDEIMGMGAQEFLASSYIRQGMEGSLLSLPPADQLRFIQDLSVGAYHPETFKDKVSEYLKLKVSELTSVDGQILSKTSSIKSQAEKIELKSKQVPLPPDEPETPFNASEQSSRVIRRDNLLSEIKALRLNKNSPYYLLSDTLVHVLNRASEIAERNTARITEIVETVRDIKIASDEEIKTAQNNISEKKRFIEAKARFIKEIQSFWNDYPEFKDTKLSVVLPQTIESLTTAINENLTQTSELSAEVNALHQSKQALSCPQCEAMLKLDGGSLTYFNCETFSEEKYQQLVKKLADYRANREVLIERKSNFVSALKTCDRLKADMGTDPDPNMNIVEALSFVTGMMDARELHKELLKEIATLRAEVEREKEAIAKIEVQLSSYGNMPAKADLSAKFDALELEAAALAVAVADGERLKSQWDLYNSSLKNIDDLKKMIQSDRDSLNADQTELFELEVVKFNLNLKIAAAKKNKELADYASISACNLILENVNEHAREYLDKFFPEDGTSVVLKNTTVTKTGIERPKLSLGIYHKGKDAKKLSNLSGGEKSRIFLAFQLALSQMYNSPFLLLDEGFAGLPPEHKSECLDILREFAEDRLLFVIEHGVNEAHFHDVITLS